MPNPFAEHSAVQRPILKYANEIGWQIVKKNEALTLRNGEAGLFLYRILELKLLELNPKVVTKENVGDDIMHPRSSQHH